MKAMNVPRCAMTMVEIIISLTLFSVVMVAVLQTMMSATNYVEFDASRTDLQTESMQFQNVVINDVASASWFYEFNPADDCAAVDPVTKARKPPMYPWVSSDGASIEFLKLRSSLKVADAPVDERYSFTNFREADTRPVDFSQYVDAVPTALMVMNPNYIQDPQWFVASVWESNRVGLNFDQNQDSELLRHYLYVVEADETGTRNLVRKYLNGYAGPQPSPDKWALDVVLLRDVTRVYFAICRDSIGGAVADPDLHENQIKVSAFLDRRPQGSASTGVTVKRQLDFTASMRSINQDN